MLLYFEEEFRFSSRRAAYHEPITRPFGTSYAEFNSIHNNVHRGILSIILTACGLPLLVDRLSVYAQEPTLIKGRIVDGAGRALEGVEVDIFDSFQGMPKLIRTYEEFKQDTGALVSVSTDREGRFRATSKLSIDKLRIAVGKQGYVGFTQSVRWALKEDPLVLCRSVSCNDLERLLHVNDGTAFKSSIIDIIASDQFESGTLRDECHFVSELFKINHRVIPLLKSILENRAILPRTTKLVSYFADHADRRILMDSLDSRRDLTKAEINDASQYLAGSLVSPDSEQEWRLLTNIITCDKRYVDDDDPLDVPFEEAALASSANGSAKALSILGAKSKCKRPPASESEIKLAIRWTKKHPQPVESFPDLKSSVTSASRIKNPRRRPCNSGAGIVGSGRRRRRAWVDPSVWVI